MSTLGASSQLPPYPETFASLERMTRAEVRAARTAIEEMIDAGMGIREIHTAGWMPGSDWSGTRFQPIYYKAARGNFELAAKIFGLLVFDIFRERPETWWTGRFETQRPRHWEPNLFHS